MINIHYSVILKIYLMIDELEASTR